MLSINTPSYVVPDHNATYFANGRTKSIQDTENNRIEFVYGPNNQRRKSEYFYDNDLITTTYYALSNCEIIIDANSNEVTKIYYIGSPDGLVSMRKTTTSTNELYYVLTDHLGSIETLCDINGNVVESYSYDPWGNPRSIENWNNYEIDKFQVTNRGFTGHEHLLNHGLINMNGRMYDPMLARMLSPDPFVTNPSLGQDYNRYSYVRNNPLKYTDPSGYIVGPPRFPFTIMDKRHYRSGRTVIWRGFGFGDSNDGRDWYDNNDFYSAFQDFSFLNTANLESYSAGFSEMPSSINSPLSSIPPFVIQFPGMVDFRRNFKSLLGLKGQTHVLPFYWGIRKATISINLGMNTNVENLNNLSDIEFSYSNQNWFKIDANWESIKGFPVTGTIDGEAANAFFKIDANGNALDFDGRLVIGLKTTYNNGGSISLNFPEGTVYNISITTRSKRTFYIPFYFLDCNWGFWQLIFQ